MSSLPLDESADGGRAQSVLGCLVAILFFLAIGYSQFIRVADEIGPAGLDVDGRAILLQSLSADSKARGADFSSEWEDSNLIFRLAIQEPMRTTIRVKYSSAVTTADDHERALRAPYTPASDSGEPIWLTSQDKESITEFNARIAELNVKTFGDWLAALGFRRYEAYEAGRLVYASDLPKVGNGNVKIAGMSR